MRKYVFASLTVVLGLAMSYIVLAEPEEVGLGAEPSDEPEDESIYGPDEKDYADWKPDEERIKNRKVPPAPKSQTSRGVINITAENQFTVGNGVTGGDGTCSPPVDYDPYVISGWSIYANNGAYGIRIDGTNITSCWKIEDVTVYGAEYSSWPSYSGAGIILYNIEEGTGVVTDVAGPWNNYGILIYNSDDLDVSDSSFNSNDEIGVYTYYSDNNTFDDVTADGNGTHGYRLSSSHYNTVENSRIEDNTELGIYVRTASYNTLRTNDIYQNGTQGIRIYSSTGTQVRTSLIQDNDYGIYFNVAYGTLIRDNLIYDNYKYGLQIYPSTSSGTQVLLNDFIDNNSYGMGGGNVQTYDAYTNVHTGTDWLDENEPCGESTVTKGNYYDDFACPTLETSCGGGEGVCNGAYDPDGAGSYADWQPYSDRHTDIAAH